MYDPREKAIHGIKGMLEDRMASEISPPKPPAPEKEPAVEGSMPEMGEGPGDGQSLEEKVPEGADLSALSPEEHEELEKLYAKMGC